jgi:hypothetical protein
LEQSLLLLVEVVAEEILYKQLTVRAVVALLLLNQTLMEVAVEEWVVLLVTEHQILVVAVQLVAQVVQVAVGLAMLFLGQHLALELKVSAVVEAAAGVSTY